MYRVIPGLVSLNIFLGSLNGNLEPSQNLSHRSYKAPIKVFSTEKPVHLFANLTDIFSIPVATMQYDWFINNVSIISGNDPHLSHNISKPGRYGIKVQLKTGDGVSDCDEFPYNKQLSGTFQTEVEMKGKLTFQAES